MGERLEKRELEVLASDFHLLDRPEVREIIRHSTSYSESRRQIMTIYDKVFMKR